MLLKTLNLHWKGSFIIMRTVLLFLFFRNGNSIKESENISEIKKDIQDRKQSSSLQMSTEISETKFNPAKYTEMLGQLKVDVGIGS